MYLNFSGIYNESFRKSVWLCMPNGKTPSPFQSSSIAEESEETETGSITIDDWYQKYFDVMSYNTCIMPCNGHVSRTLICSRNNLWKSSSNRYNDVDNYIGRNCSKYTPEDYIFYHHCVLVCLKDIFKLLWKNIINGQGRVVCTIGSEVHLDIDARRIYVRFRFEIE